MCDEITGYGQYDEWVEAWKVTRVRDVFPLSDEVYTKEYTGPFSNTPIIYRKIMQAEYHPWNKRYVFENEAGFAVFLSLGAARIYKTNRGKPYYFIRRVKVRGKITKGVMQIYKGKRSVPVPMVMAKQMRMFGRVKDV